MSAITNYVEISTKSLAVAGIVFLIVSVIAKYLLELYNVNLKDEDKRSSYITILYSVVIGLIFALLSLVLFKQFCKFGTCDILTTPFPNKLQ